MKVGDLVRFYKNADIIPDQDLSNPHSGALRGSSGMNWGCGIVECIHDDGNVSVLWPSPHNAWLVDAHFLEVVSV